MKRATGMEAIVFLGGGRITNALVAGLRLAKYDKPILVHDRNPEKLRQFKRQYGVAAEPNLQRAVAKAGLILIAVRPDSVSDLLLEIGELGKEKPRRPLLLVSLAAGIPLSKLRARLPSPAHWARAMPSPVCRSGRGLTALTFDSAFSRTARRDIKDFFEKVGDVLEIPESQLDVFTATFSSSHGYHALAALAASAQRLGLNREIAMTAAAHALADGILSWRESKTSLTELLHEAATPGGTAAAAMRAMDSSGYERTILQGLRAGIARARQNAKRS
ncbi:MAG: pyrroline-5-carboxylate reductase dimerization domain-containing protein [Terriglobales bacterium]